MFQASASVMIEILAAACAAHGGIELLGDLSNQHLNLFEVKNK